MKPVRVVVHDKMQRRYVYERVCAPGKKFHPDFRPELTPKQMLALGVFGGVYLRDCTPEFPTDWFARAKLANGPRDPKLNYFGVNASQPLTVWRANGWIHPQDPRGWFQWYCRYYMGRRSEDDDRQIGRWRAMRRHLQQIRRNCPSRLLTCRKRQRQALLHWAYDARKI